MIPLKEGGDSIPVTQENKKEFVQLSAKYRLVSSIEQQISHLSQGFYEIVPKELVTIVCSFTLTHEGSDSNYLSSSTSKSWNY